MIALFLIKLLNRPILIVEPKNISNSEIINSLFNFKQTKQDKNLYKDYKLRHLCNSDYPARMKNTQAIYHSLFIYSI